MIVITTFTLLLIILAVYLVFVRPWQLNWGAIDREINEKLPGDEIIDKPTFNATRAISINAHPKDIWPWLIQMGYGRGGWYSYDWIDNLGKPSATSIQNHLQDIHIGQLIPISPDGKHGFYVNEYDINNWILWTDRDGRTSWLWKLTQNGDTTRLISRIRIRYSWLSPTIIFFLFLDFGDIIMMAKCLKGIKERSESKD